MFKKIAKKLFNVRDNLVVERPKSFSENVSLPQSSPKVNVQESTANEAEAVASVDVSALFYSLLFPARRSRSNGVANELEKSVIAKVESALASPQAIADTVLKLPTQVIELDRKLAGEELDTKDVLALIQKDPVLSAEVLKLCNSPVFRRNERDITSLQQALVQLGRNQLRRFVSSCLVREVVDIKPIYFRRFGAQIWRHSMQVAFLSSELADADADSAFLLGLLHDVGKIAIFKILLEAFKQADPGEQPSSGLFRQVMTSKSLSLSALLANCWALPLSFESELNRLAVVDSKPAGGLAAVVWRANLISECSMLHQAGLLESGCLNRLLSDAELTREEFDVLHEKLQQF